ncbi:MAG: hypothetical protein QS721_15285 [Candidatus Endonucleobacter sp. (ex Gigantidas childressi)]|nr:hypothetical protein [Candidatus Endonucleobacter sp. (ex Gigantidas childressi)]
MKKINSNSCNYISLLCGILLLMHCCIANSGPTSLSSESESIYSENVVVMQLTKFKLSEVSDCGSCCKRESILVNISATNFINAPVDFHHASWSVTKDILTCIFDKRNGGGDKSKNCLTAEFVKLPCSDEYDFMAVAVYSKLLTYMDIKDDRSTFEVIDKDKNVCAFTLAYDKIDIDFLMALMCYGYEIRDDDENCPHHSCHYNTIYKCTVNMMSELVDMQVKQNNILESSVGYNLLYIVLCPQRIVCRRNNREEDCKRQTFLLSCLLDKVQVFTDKWMNILKASSCNMRFLDAAYIAHGSAFKKMLGDVTPDELNENAKKRFMLISLLKMQDKKNNSAIDYSINGGNKETFLYLFNLMNGLGLLDYINYFQMILSTEEIGSLVSISREEGMYETMVNLIRSRIKSLNDKGDGDGHELSSMKTEAGCKSNDTWYTESSNGCELFCDVQQSNAWSHNNISCFEDDSDRLMSEPLEQESINIGRLASSTFSPVKNSILRLGSIIYSKLGVKKKGSYSVNYTKVK